MADTAITGLTADASPTTDDLIVTVNDPGGTPANRKVTLSDLFGLLDDQAITWTALQTVSGGVRMAERADHAATPAAGFAEIWVSNDATQVPYFTDDAGADREILTSTSGTTLTAATSVGADALPFFDASDSNNAKSTTVTNFIADNSIATLTGSTAALEHIAIAVSDETTALTTGTAKATFRMPYAFTLTAVRASVTTAPTGATLNVDINEGGASVLSTVITIDATETTSTTAATPAVISDSALADDAEITIDIDQVGSTVAGAGLKVYLIGRKA